MKNGLLTFIAFLFIGVVTYADCTVTTQCNTYSFPNENSVSVSAQSIANGVLIKILGANGQVLATETCNSGVVSQECSSGGGDEGEFDICDYLPPYLAKYCGCNE